MSRSRMLRTWVSFGESRIDIIPSLIDVRLINTLSFKIKTFCSTAENPRETELGQIISITTHFTSHYNYRMVIVCTHYSELPLSLFSPPLILFLRPISCCGSFDMLLCRNNGKLVTSFCSGHHASTLVRGRSMSCEIIAKPVNYLLIHSHPKAHFTRLELMTLQRFFVESFSCYVCTEG